MSMIDVSETERKIAERIDPASAGALELSQEAGGLGFSNMGEAMQFAKVMAISGIAVRKHLRGNVGACLAITIQAVEWRMSPFAVASKTYEVNGQLAYESQLIQAVVLQRAPIKGRFDVAFSGEGERRQCTVTAALKDGGERSYTSPEIGKIPIKNSSLWKNDPDQQLFYYSGRALCRRYFPDVLLGIYAPEELEEPRRGPEHARDVTPKKTTDEKLDAIAAGGNGDPPHDPETGEIKSIVGDDGRSYSPTHSHDVRDPGITHPPATAQEAGMKDAGASGGLAPASDPLSLALEHSRAVAASATDAAARQFDEPNHLQSLLDQGRAVATNGKAKYRKWENNLSAPEFDRLGPHLEALREAAAAADGGGGPI